LARTIASTPPPRRVPRPFPTSRRERSDKPGWWKPDPGRRPSSHRSRQRGLRKKIISDHRHDRYGPQEVGQLQMIEDLDRPRAVKAGRLYQFGVSATEAPEAGSAPRTESTPADNQSDGEQWDTGEKLNGAEPTGAGDPGKEAEHRVHQHILPDSARSPSHDKKGCNDQQRQMLRPGKSWSSRREKSVPPTKVITKTSPTRNRVFPMATHKPGCSAGSGNFPQPAKTLFREPEGIALPGKPERHRQRTIIHKNKKATQGASQRRSVKAAAWFRGTDPVHLSCLPCRARSASSCARASACSTVTRPPTPR